MVSLGLDDFVIGTNDGGVYRCWSLGRQAASERSSKRQLQLLPLRRHRFMVSTLLRTEMDGHQIVISCDLSGQAYYHDMRHEDEVLFFFLTEYCILIVFEPLSPGYCSIDCPNTVTLQECNCL